MVDKPGQWTSHDVVGRMRTLAGTRRVGHAGTLDPMATGVLVIGIGRATRLLGHISGADKSYAATFRLGWGTVTDDREGERLVDAERGTGAAELSEAAIRRGIAALTGTLMQRPATVSAIKVQGRRSHERVRSGEQVDLPERLVTVSAFDLLDLRRDRDADTLDLDVQVTCSSGTYIRALARDLGAALDVGGHLTALRRSRVGVFMLDHAHSLDELDRAMDVTPMAQAARTAFPSLTVSAPDANAVRHGRSIELGMAWARAAADDPTATTDLDPGAPAHARVPDRPDRPVPPHALFAPDGDFLALAAPRPDGTTKYLAVFSQP